MCYWSFKPIKSCSSRPSQVIALWLDETQPQSRKRLSHNRNIMSLANRKLATNVTPDDIISLVNSSIMVECQCDISKRGLEINSGEIERVWGYRRANYVRFFRMHQPQQWCHWLILWHLWKGPWQGFGEWSSMCRAFGPTGSMLWGGRKGVGGTSSPVQCRVGDNPAFIFFNLEPHILPETDYLRNWQNDDEKHGHRTSSFFHSPAWLSQPLCCLPRFWFKFYAPNKKACQRLDALCTASTIFNYKKFTKWIFGGGYITKWTFNISPLESDTGHMLTQGRLTAQQQQRGGQHWRHHSVDCILCCCWCFWCFCVVQLVLYTAIGASHGQSR